MPEGPGRSRFVDNEEIRMLKCPHVDGKDVTKWKGAGLWI